MKKFQFSIRNKFLLAVFLGCLFPYVVGGIYLKDTLEKQLYASNAEHTGQLLSQVQQFFDKTLVENMSNKVDYLASLAAVKSGRDGLLDYTGFKGSDPLQPPGPLEASISPLFETMKFSNKSINFVFFGTESGGYMEYPRFVPLNAYDPRLRPWYVATKTEAKLVMSEPYITNTTNDLVVSFTKPVVQEGAMVGVVGLTVRLDELMNSVAGVRLGKTGSIWVLSPDRHFMLSPLNREWIMHTPDELGLSGLSSLGYGDAASFEGVVEGRTLLMRTLVSEQSGLYFVAAMDKAEVLSQATVVTNLFVGMYSLTFALVVALIFWISNRMTGSILVFAQVIRRMTDFEFRLEDNREIMGYAKTKDEIGVVASSLVELHNNFYELMKQVRWLDEEIKTLEVEDGAALTLEVSEQNPFSGVVSSMNGLLDRMREYVAKLRSSTEELGEKNGLLVVSEGKLHSQLEQIKEKNEYIHYLAYHDSLTGLPNRRKFVEELTNKLADGQSGAVVLLDIDDFKGINDTLGHVFGDKVLVRIATLLLEIQEEGMFVSRFGGDEYLLLLRLYR